MPLYQPRKNPSRLKYDAKYLAFLKIQVTFQPKFKLSISKDREIDDRIKKYQANYFLKTDTLESGVKKEEEKIDVQISFSRSIYKTKYDACHMLVKLENQIVANKIKKNA